MAIAVKTSAALVKPLNGLTIVHRFTAGTGGTTAGAIVAMGTDGVVLCDGSTTPNVIPVGIALQTVAATLPVDVVTHGPVECVTGASEGSAVYATDGTAGAPSHSASTKKYSVGPALSATAIFVRPIYVA